ncbi:hypothetical protein ABZ801_01320 [Actinomadura sp. NPDC047616]|uniref:helix-turn-helix transcriptional regulator n=1 Tax=Actinomadura sp. NPDC047616 TaxID=3155914 RepID=UPI0033DD357B
MGVQQQPPDDAVARWWTVEDIADHCDVSVVTVYRWRSQGDLPQPRDPSARPMTWDPQVIRDWAKQWFRQHREPEESRESPLWGVDEVADYLGVKPVSVHRYKSRGDMPEPTRYFGRSPAWKPEVIIEWVKERPSGNWKQRRSRQRSG